MGNDSGAGLYRRWLTESVTREVLDVFLDLAQDAREFQDLDAGVEVPSPSLTLILTLTTLPLP